MKKVLYLFIGIFVVFIPSFLVLTPVNAQDGRNYNQNPVDILETVKRNANKDKSEQVQKTDLDVVTSNYSACDGIAPDSRFTITRTLCSIKANLKDYLQYVMYIGLVVATILLIWNGFKIVTSEDREKQMTVFKKNLLYIVIGVVLLIGFYYIIDIFVTVVNLISE